MIPRASIRIFKVQIESLLKYFFQETFDINLG